VRAAANGLVAMTSRQWIAAGIIATLPLLGSHYGFAQSGTPQAATEGESHAACARDLKQSIADLDRLIDASPRSIKAFDSVRKQMPKGPCDVDEVISIAKTSKFYSSVYDWRMGYTILIATDNVHFSFGITKDSGTITNPSAIPRCGGKACL